MLHNRDHAASCRSHTGSATIDRSDRSVTGSRTFEAVTRRIGACSSAVRVVGLRLAIADRRVEVGEEVKRVPS